MAGPRQILHAHLLLKNNLLHTGAGEALLAHAGAGEEAAVHDVTGEGQGGAVHDRAAEIVDGLLVHARACEEAAVHDGAEEDAEAVFVHMGSGEEVAEALLVHVRADCRGWLGTVTGERGTLRLSWE